MSRRLLLLLALLIALPLSAISQVSTGTTFGGVNYSPEGWGPLDPNGAAGPNHICQIVNTALAIYTKSGQLIEFKDLASFSGSAGIDPTVVYDTTVQRWVICSGLKDVFFAVSDTSDPTQGWSEFHTVNFPGSYDGGRFGFNASAYFLVYPDNPNMIVIDKSTVLDKNNSTFTWYRYNAPGNKTLMMDDTADPVANPGDPMWFYDSTHLYKVTNYLSNSPTVQTINVTGGSIITSKYAEVRNGKMVGIRDFGALSWSVTDLASATVTQSGTIPTPTGYGTTHLNYISIAPNGDIAVTFLADTSDNNRMSMFVTGRAPSDPAGTMRTPVAVGTGSHTGNRMGDYCSVMEDPVTGTFWAFNQPDDNGYYTLISNLGISNVPPAPLPQVAGFGILPSDGTNVSVQWNAVPGATSYQLLRSTDNVKFTTVATLSSATTNYTDTPAAPVSNYYYELVASNAQATSGAYGTVKVVLAPAPPTYNALPAPGNVVASLGTGNAIQLDWSDISGETGYAVERAGNGSTWTQIGTTAAGVVQYIDSNPAGSNLYFYRVSSLGTGGTKSVPSTVVSIANRPSAPSVTVTNVLDNQLQLIWNAHPSATKFTISRSTDGANYSVVGTAPANFYTFTDSGLTPMTQYYYKVVANGIVGDSLAGTATGTPRLIAPTIAVAQGTNQLSVSWSGIANANSYQVDRSTDGTNFSTVATVATTSYNDTTVTPLAEYYYRVTASNTSNGDTSLPSAVDFGVLPGTLPAGWLAQDIGGSGVGAAGFSSNTYTVFGLGADIWGTSDQFHYDYRSLSGDGMIMARVATQQNTGGWAKAGVMIRETTGAGSAHAMMVLTPSNGTAFQWRSSTGGSSSNNNTGGFVAPYWVKLVRSGNTFSAYRSSNGTSWTQQGSPVVIPMAASVDIGLAVDSANGNALSKVTFDNVSLLAAAADSLAVNPGGPGTVNVLANDVGPSGATLTVTAVTQGTKGTVVNNGNGTVTYTAGANASGTDSFGYTVSDGLGDTATGTVNVSIGGLFREVWNNVGGGSVANLTSDPRYPNSPDLSEVVLSAETPQSYGDNYGQRLRGWIKPPTTGNYKFFISSDDASELWLSTNDSAGSKVKIAQVTGWTGYRAYSSGGQSALIPLTAGLRYYVEILHKEGGGGDHLSVAWQKPGDPVPADGSAPIDGQYLQSFSANNAPAFTSNPVSKPAATAGSSYTASLAGDASDPDAGDTLTFSKVSGPAWLNIAANGALSGTPASGDVGANSWTVRVTDSGGLAASATLNISVNSSGSLPPGWTGGDIGSVGVAGSASASGGTYTVSGSGSDIWGTADGFQFVSQDLVGNGEIRARVTSQTNSDPWAKAGVMIRDGTSAGAAHAMMVITPGNGFAFQYRSAADGASATVAGPALNGAPNNWVRVTRSGTLLTTYVSANGTTWTQVGTATISMSATVKAGLAVTSHNNSVLSTATFDNVAVTTFPAPWQTVDIGTTGLQGSAEYYNAAYTVKGAGNISGTADNFRYVYQTLSGDGEIKVRIQAPGNTGTSARLGVMIRDALTGGSAYAFMGVDGGGAYYWQRRSSTGATTASIASGSGTVPNLWVRVVRAGNALTGYKSSDGVNWTQVSSRNITMGTNIYVGMVDASGSTSTLNTTVFDNVTVVP